MSDVLLTGASGVIGHAVARRLIADGMRLHVCVRDSKNIAEGVECLCHVADLRNRSEAEEAVREFFDSSECPTGMVLAAGHLGMPGAFAETEWTAWEEALTTNFLSHAAMIRYFAREFAARNLTGGSIVTFSGVGLGGNVSFKNVSGHSTAKAALNHLVEAIAPELARLDIIINAIAPGAVISDITEQAIKAEAKAPEFAAAARKIKESGGVPADLSAELVAFLLGPDARTITGRLLSARFDQQTVRERASEIASDPNWYRLRRIDYELFIPKPK